MMNACKSFAYVVRTHFLNKNDQWSHVLPYDSHNSAKIIQPKYLCTCNMCKNLSYRSILFHWNCISLVTGVVMTSFKFKNMKGQKSRNLEMLIRCTTVHRTDHSPKVLMKLHQSFLRSSSGKLLCSLQYTKNTLFIQGQ
jgi:hypothetical protein